MSGFDGLLCDMSTLARLSAAQSRSISAENFTGEKGKGGMATDGTGALSQVSLRHKPDVYHEPQVFAALHVKGAKTARVLEGPVPMWKAFGSVTPGGFGEPGTSLAGRTYGLPRFAEASFRARFPCATVKLTDKSMPVAAEITGWSPFTPGTADDSSLPVAAIEYRFVNRSARPVKAVFSFHAANFMKTGDGTLDGQGAAFAADEREKARGRNEHVLRVVVGAQQGDYTDL